MRLDELNALAEDPTLWDDPTKAQSLMRERNILQERIGDVTSLETESKDIVELIDLAEMEDDTALQDELETQLQALQEKAEKLQLKSLLSGEADLNDAYLEINAGAGGTEAQDWANMLLRMYCRWCDANGFSYRLLNETSGDEAGIKSATIQINGDYAFGWIKTERGVHRLVRISPFDSNAKRHTSFASIMVSPVIDDNIEITVSESDLRIDTFRSSGAGGQHVNTTDSAVRITHIPTGIVAACQSERSQHQNKAHAMSMLKAKLYERELEEKERAAQQEQAEKTDIGWGHQIRSYVLHPYQMIKDLRTGVETSDSQAVLNGALNPFLEAALAHGMGQDEDDSAE